MTETASQNFMPVTRSIITWARKRAGYSLSEAQKSFKKIEEWETGEPLPTYPQLESMADKFKVPIAVFFFPSPPDVPEIDETFRTLSQGDLEKIPPKIRLLLRKATAMQISLVELNDGANPAKQLVTKDMQFDINDSIDTMANSLRAYFGISIEEQFSWNTTEEALENWRRVLYEHGVFVFKDAFREKGYSGFCLYDDEFPVIYINNTSTKTKQIFTLFHELAHLLFHTSGIDFINDDYVNALPNTERKIEIICNRFAGKFLIPEDVFNNESLGLLPNRDTAALLANRFGVSREAIYRKFLDRNLIPQNEYHNAVKKWNQEAGSKSSSGGDFYNNQMSYLGQRYIGLAFERFYQNRFDMLQLADYLNMTPKNVPALEERYLRAATR